MYFLLSETFTLIHHQLADQKKKHCEWLYITHSAAVEEEVVSIYTSIFSIIIHPFFSSHAQLAIAHVWGPYARGKSHENHTGASKASQ